MKNLKKALLALIAVSILSVAAYAGTSIWGSTDRGPVVSTYRIPVDTSSSSGPGYVTPAELQTFMAASVNSVSTSTNAGATAGTMYVYLVTGTSTITLPTAVGNKAIYVVKNVDATHTTSVTSTSGTLDGSATVTMPVQYTSLSFVSDGTNWNIF